MGCPFFTKKTTSAKLKSDQCREDLDEIKEKIAQTEGSNDLLLVLNCLHL